MDWKRKLEDVLPYVMVMMMIYYGCPLFMNDTGSSIIMMLAVMPAAAFLCAFFCGLKRGFRILYLVLAAVIFIPEYWVFLNDWEALGFYMLMYTATALLGMLLGWGVGGIVKRILER